MADLVHKMPFGRVSDSGRNALIGTPPVDDEHICVVDSYDRAMRSYNETDQLFAQFEWCYQELRRLAPCDRGDFLTDNFQSGKFNARTVVNGAFGNFISAARNVIDKMDAVMADYSGGKKSEGYLKFKKLPSSWFDQGGLYVLMYELRNQVQHGQIVVSVVNELGRMRLRFDLDQIGDPNLFKISKKLKSFVSRTSAAIRAIDSEGSPYLCFRYSNMLYHEMVIELYAHFLKCVQPYIREANARLRAMLAEHEEFVGQNRGSKFVAYDKDNETHVFDGLEFDGLKLVRNRSKEIEKSLCEAKKMVACERRQSIPINPVCAVLNRLMSQRLS